MCLALPETHSRYAKGTSKIHVYTAKKKNSEFPVRFFWLAPGELPVEAQFTEFQQGARGASLVANNRPKWYANIETGYIGP
jgi:hypothetical protein